MTILKLTRTATPTRDRPRNTCHTRARDLTRDKLPYILDPADMDVHGLDFPGETFRVLKEKQITKFGEYRTHRLVLEAWDKLQAA